MSAMMRSTLPFTSLRGTVNTGLPSSSTAKVSLRTVQLSLPGTDSSRWKTTVVPCAASTAGTFTLRPLIATLPSADAFAPSSFTWLVATFGLRPST